MGALEQHHGRAQAVAGRVKGELNVAERERLSVRNLDGAAMLAHPQAVETSG
jgi:hypothetical protein